MKRVTLSVLILCAFVFSIPTIAQTTQERAQIKSKLNLETLHQLKEEAAATYQAKRQYALEQAAIYGWEESYEIGNGGFGLLVDVVDGQPIYFETTNDEAAITARTDRVHSGGGAGLDLNGENMLVGVWDGGLVRESHELFENRVEQMDSGSGLSAHATHVTGTIVGSGAFQNGDAKGMAPLATTINYSFADDTAEVLAAISDHGLLVSNHSYGVPADGGSGAALPAWVLGKYSNISRFWDQIHFNAPNYLSVWSAGNARNTQHNNLSDNGYDLLTHHSMAKNTLVVAATFRVLNYTSPSSVIMSQFSSWGPTDDGRIKPDISAKGVNTLSSISTTNSSYANFSGTSMSSPSVAGSVLLLQQHYNTLNSAFMRSSSLRGLVLHTADEAGFFPGPDFRFGWGLINTERAAAVISNDGTNAHILERVLPDGQSLEITGTAVGGEPLVASITWIDRQGVANSTQIEDEETSVLVNDLDMRIFDESNTMHMPWIIDFDHSTPSTYNTAASRGDNFRDNIEKIEIDDATGDYTIVISHKGTLNAGEQAVSIILTGIENINETLGTPSNEFVNVSVFPNPATNKLNIQAITAISQIEIMNILGQTITVKQVNSNTAQLDVSQFKTGAYFVRVTIDNASKVYKFIKK